MSLGLLHTVSLAQGDSVCETEAKQRLAQSRGRAGMSENLAQIPGPNCTSKSWWWASQLGKPARLLQVVCLCGKLKMATKSLTELPWRGG